MDILKNCDVQPHLAFKSSRTLEAVFFLQTVWAISFPQSVRVILLPTMERAGQPSQGGAAVILAAWWHGHPGRPRPNAPQLEEQRSATLRPPSPGLRSSANGALSSESLLQSCLEARFRPLLPSFFGARQNQYVINNKIKVLSDTEADTQTKSISYRV